MDSKEERSAMAAKVHCLMAGKPGSDECRQSLQTFMTCCTWLGLPLKQAKLVGPTTDLDFLGVILDTEMMERKSECRS